MTRPSSAEQLRQYATPASVYTSVVTGIIWYFMSLAIKRNQGFAEGAFICRDPHKRLAAYFRMIGVPRISSHLKRHSSPGCTGGIDLVASNRVPPLPYGHRHVLFIVIEGNRLRDSCLFLKPERHGVASLGDKFFHAVSWTRSMIFRCFGLNTNNNSAPTRKERIPAQLVQGFAGVVTNDPDGAAVLAEVGVHDAGEGIAGMHVCLLSLLPLLRVFSHMISQRKYLALLAEIQATLQIARVIFTQARWTGFEQLKSLTKRSKEYLTKKVKLLQVDENDPLPPLYTFLQLLESTYDFPTVRFGNEVFLDLSADPSTSFPEAPG